MDLSKIMAINGKSGLFELIGENRTGLIVKGLKDNKKQFVSARTHIFSMLSNIAIYTEDESENLEVVLQAMFRKEEELALPDVKKASPQDLKDYLAAVLPTYDRDRVYLSDMRKLVKWYGELRSENRIDLEPSPEAKAAAEATNEKDEEKSEKSE